MILTNVAFFRDPDFWYLTGVGSGKNYAEGGAGWLIDAVQNKGDGQPYCRNNRRGTWDDVVW